MWISQKFLLPVLFPDSCRGKQYLLGGRKRKGTEKNRQQPTTKEKSPLPVQARQTSKWTIPQDGGPSSVGQREMDAEGMQVFVLKRPEFNRAATKPPVKTPAVLSWQKNLSSLHLSAVCLQDGICFILRIGGWDTSLRPSDYRS